MNYFRTWYHDGNEYRINKPIMWVVSFLIASLLLYVLAWDSFSGVTHGYSFCDKPVTDEPLNIGNGCYNLFYNSNVCGKDSVKFFGLIHVKGLDVNDPLCTTEFMRGGESLGVKPPLLFNYFWWFVVGIFLVGMALNHLLFNVDYSKKNNEPIGGNLG